MKDKTARITPPAYLVVSEPTSGDVIYRTPTALKTIAMITAEAQKLHKKYPGKAVHALGTERGFGAEKVAVNLPADVERYVDEAKKQDPGIDESKAWAIAWSRYCKYKNPGSPHCKKDKGDYFPNRAASEETMSKAAALDELKKLAMNKKADRPLWQIAKEIRQDWKNIYFGAKPYLEAMAQLDSIDDMFYEDSAHSVVVYFLSNATTWRGEVAKRIKLELKQMAAHARRKYALDDLEQMSKTAGLDWLKKPWNALPRLDTYFSLLSDYTRRVDFYEQATHNRVKGYTEVSTYEEEWNPEEPGESSEVSFSIFFWWGDPIRVEIRANEKPISHRYGVFEIPVAEATPREMAKRLNILINTKAPHPHFQHPDTPSLEDTMPLEYFTERLSADNEDLPGRSAAQQYMAPTPDYDWWDQNASRYRASITRAVKLIKTDPKKALAVAEEWFRIMDQRGYPDDWSRVQRLKDDAEVQIQRNRRLFAKQDDVEDPGEVERMLADFNPGGTEFGKDDRHPELDEGSLIPGIEERLAALEKLAKEKYPWDECIKDQMKQYGDKGTAEKVCGKIKSVSQGGGKSAAEDEEGTLSRYEEGKPADPTEQMSPEDAKKWKEMNEEHGDQFKKARFEQGKPADPTVNMSPEDAEKWKEMNEKYKDSFKAAAAFVPFPPTTGLEGAWGTRPFDGREAENKTASGPTGLYGFTRKVQADCEACARKLSRTATKVAKRIYAKDGETAPFLATHAKRGPSTPAEILIAAMRDLGPKVDLEEKEKALEDQNKTAGEKTAEYSMSPADKKVVDAFLDKKEEDSKKLKSDGKTLDGLWMGGSGIAVWEDGKIEMPDLGERAAQTVQNYITRNAPKSYLKTAGARTYGLYGFGSRTANLGLAACMEIREAAGTLASDLHQRRADSHEHITGFLSRHAEEGGCLYSRLLHASYPDATRKTASTSDEWLEWEE